MEASGRLHSKKKEVWRLYMLFLDPVFSITQWVYVTARRHKTNEIGSSSVLVAHTAGWDRSPSSSLAPAAFLHCRPYPEGVDGTLLVYKYGGACYGVVCLVHSLFFGLASYQTFTTITMSFKDFYKFLFCVLSQPVMRKVGGRIGEAKRRGGGRAVMWPGQSPWGGMCQCNEAKKKKKKK